MNKNINNLQGVKKVSEKYKGVYNYTPPQVDGDCVRLNLNENLYGPSPRCLETLKNISQNNLCFYSLESEDDLVNTIANTFMVDTGQVLLHNGSSEMIRMIFEMVLDRDERILLPNPGWSYYTGVSNINQYQIAYYSVDEGEGTYYIDIKKLCAGIDELQPSVVVITTPNMPTGNSVTQEELEQIMDKCKEQIFVIDQAYWGFAEEKICVSEFINKYSNVIFVRTFSKFYGLANERIGFCLSNKKLIDIFRLNRPLFKLSYTSRMLAKVALEDTEYYDNIREIVTIERKHFILEMNKISGINAFQSDSNFVYVKIKNKDVEGIQKKLKDSGYLVRVFKLDDEYCLRITIYNRQVMDYVIQAFREYM